MAQDSERLGFFESRRVAKDADRAMAAGRYDQALELFALLVDGLPKTDKRHGEALYGAALASLAQDPQDRSAAVDYLDALPRGAGPRAEIQALRNLINVGVEEPAEKKSNEVAESKPCPTPEPTVGTDDGEMKKENQRLKAELAEAKAELKRKDEALEKLKAVVVGGG